MSYPKYQYQYFFHIRFLRIFYHDYSSKVAFDSLEEAENVNTQYKFSILNEIDESYKIDGKYEFLLNYSDINNCNWWRQTNFPLEETLSSSDTHVKGYEPLHISWKSNNFGGLEKTPFHFKYNCVVITSILHTLNLKKIDTAEMYQMIQPYVVENIRLYQAICWLTNALYKFPKPDEAFCGMVQWHPKQSFDLYEIYFYDSFDSAFKVANSGRNEFDFDSAEDFIKNWQVMFRIDYTNLPGDVQKMKDTKLLWDKIAERTNLPETNDDDEYDSESEFVK